GADAVGEVDIFRVHKHVVIDLPEPRLRRRGRRLGPRGNQNEGGGRRGAGCAYKLTFCCVHETLPIGGSSRQMTSPGTGLLSDSAPAIRFRAMQPFTKLTGVAAPLPMVNVDTDMIIPKQFL